MPVDHDVLAVGATRYDDNRYLLTICCQRRQYLSFSSRSSYPKLLVATFELVVFQIHQASPQARAVAARALTISLAQVGSGLAWQMFEVLVVLLCFQCFAAVSGLAWCLREVVLQR
jgi:hypothetical protein